jgi:signal transduction histidine kinase
VVEFDCGDEGARLRVSDDGVGFDPGSVLDGDAKPGWGLVGIRERVQLAGGGCQIESTPGKGTTVIAEILLLATKETGNGAH